MLATTNRPAPRYRDAEEIALAAFGYIAWRSDELADFMFATGLDSTTAREAAKTPQFLAGVLDYVVGEPGLLDRVARALDLRAIQIDEARRELLPAMPVSAATPECLFGPALLDLRCEHCRKIRPQDWRRWPHVPARVVRIDVPRCGPCGGGFGGPETWTDASGDEVGPDL